MKVDVSKLISKEVSATSEHGLDEEVAIPDRNSAQIQGKVLLTRLDQSILAKFDITASLNLNCDKCLESFREQLPLSFDREYSLVPSDDPEVLAVGDGELDTDLAIAQEVSISLPLQVVCKPDCKGLDPTTGENLNLTEA
ncbi:TPA: hypothetical protein DHW58_01745 [Patescibacteria group bacterium]|uniref:DUF177 domain-containing protein n=2 Tax=Bacteria division Kazan-3B-28 TaxID=1798534 RepID=A0A0G1X6P1_UNCK3|nr:MAG: hypothetical protein VE98_C0001G0202 [candidate division Kazan bacterium GW2011_GWA1_50_15]KKW25522.1 MAG: hypothetical protein VE99_C0001G0159 [candidate division Kazan bacterium GW2011_GWC1_52_13]KKW26828.1 MAG: hypothetical protein VF00_C0002G0153 [candidate division Kazan bacterium GW2011_GWB1_52_7]HAV65821.1 hypothetical protein [Patescibacteria group bacterium]HCL47693.1 hypothetical protein [Patescibacteria group bacterium]